MEPLGNWHEMHPYGLPGPGRGGDSMETDPVCRMLVAPETAAAKAEHAGAVYYFCCVHCREAFVADPGRYLYLSETESETHRHPGEPDGYA